MLARYQEFSGYQPSEESDVMLRMRVLAGEIYKEKVYAAYILRQMFPSTAEGEYLDKHAAQRLLTRKAATKATGSVVFTAAEAEHDAITVPAGTVVCTAADTKRFVTNADCVIPPESRMAGVTVTAEQPGSSYNVAAQTVGIIVTPVIGIGEVKNVSRFTGGSDRETDDKLRERIADSFRNISNGTNAAYYRALAMSVDGVYSASAVGCGRGAGTVDVYISGRGTTLPAVKLQEVQTLIAGARELNVDVRVLSPSAVNINLYIKLTTDEGYVFADVANAVRTAVSDYIDGLGIGHDVLLSDIGEIVYHIKGVKAYRFLESYGSDRTISNAQYPRSSSILVRDE